MFDRSTEGTERLSLSDVLDLVQRRARWLVLGSVVGLGLGLAALAVVSPAFRASATLLLEQNRSEGVLGELAALTSAPISESEMEILRSRSIAEAVVESPAGDALAPDATSDPLHLGLTTTVEDEGLAPLRRLMATFTGEATDLDERPRLSADLRHDEDVTLRVRFPAADRVALSVVSAPDDPGEREQPFVPGATIEYAGARLRLAVAGDPTGHSFLVRARSRQDAIEELMATTRVTETQRSSGVIEVLIEDTDPRRAAAIANALCRNYLAKNQRRSEARATRTVEFIEQQLAEQIELLQRAEADVVEFKRANPEFVDIGSAAEALIDELAQLELQAVQTRLEHVALGDALERMESGDAAAMARMGPGLYDPIATTFSQNIAQLTTESELLDRVDGGPYKTLLNTRLVELRSALQANRLKHATLAYLAAELEAGDTTALGGLVNASDPGTDDPLLSSKVVTWSDVASRLRKLREEFTDEMPEVRALLAERAELERDILALLRGRLGGLDERRAEYERMIAEEERLLADLPELERAHIDDALGALADRTRGHARGRLEGLERTLESLADERRGIEERLAQLPDQERRLADPLRRVAAHGEIVKLLLSHQQEAEIARAGSAATAEFLDPAVPPMEPHGPSIPLYLALGLLAGLGAAFGFVLLRESLDRSIFTAAELEEASGLPVLATIPDHRRGPGRSRIAKAGLIPLLDDPECAAAESYRALRTSLALVLRQSQAKTLAITSCQPGEGKSVTNVSVAYAFALSERRVLIIDADMRRSSVSRYLDAPSEPGLSEVLAGRTPWRDSVVRTQHPNLDLLPTGSRPDSPGDLLASEDNLAFLQEVRAEYDLIVFDVPPALAVADTECLARHIDVMLLLCRSAKLGEEVVARAAAGLKQGGANLVGAILNAARPDGGAKKYGYQYGYSYGYEDREKDSSRRKISA